MTSIHIITQTKHESTQEKKCEFIIDKKKTYGLKKPERNFRQCIICKTMLVLVYLYSNKTKGIRKITT